MSQAKIYNGKTIREWSETCGIPVKTIKNRLKEKWTIEEAIAIQPGKRRKTTIKQIATDNKINQSTLRNRMAKGMSLEDAIIYDPRKNYIGMRSGKLVVEKELAPKRDPSGRSRRRFLCKCDCGNETTALAEEISNQSKRSCGCLKKELLSKEREIILTGQSFGRWYIESEAFRDKFGIHWNAICECGNKGTPTTNNLLKGVSTSCGCYVREQTSLRERKDITGQRFFKLTAIECIGKDDYNNCLWRCLCDCGNEIITTAARLLGGQVLSCGCVKSKNARVIEDIFLSKNIYYIKEKYFKDLKLVNYLYFDFCILDHNKDIHLIEYQGKQHYVDSGSFGKQQREVTDQMKKDYCSKNNIPLYEIRYDENVETRLYEIIAHVNPVLNSELTEEV